MKYKKIFEKRPKSAVEVCYCGIPTQWFLSFYVSNYFFVFLHTFFSLFPYSFHSRRFIFCQIFSPNSALFNFFRKSFSEKKFNIGVSVIPSLRSSLVFQSFVLTSHTTFVSVFPCPTVFPLLFCVFLFPLLRNNL